MTSVTLALFSLTVAIAVAAAGLTAGIRAWAVSKHALVEPSGRCAHTIPTPHGGGIAIAAISIMLGLLFSVLNWVPVSAMVAFICLGFMMLVLGVWDDFGDVSAKFRLVMHFLLVGLGLMAIPKLPTFSLAGFEIDSSTTYLLWPLLTIAWVWLINLYNFMDGIDGLAAVQALILFGGMAFNFWFMGFTQWGWMCLFMFAAVLGFTMLNWPPAKIFMGDGGSGFLGFVIGFLMLLSASQTNVSLWSWIIILTLFIADATVTLVTRAATRQNPMQAHNLHAYQKLARRCGRHSLVTVGYGLVMAFGLVPVSLLANVFPHSGPVLFALVIIPACGFMIYIGAGRREAIEIE